MKYPEMLLWLPLAAFILDILLGDPRFLPHPVRLIGLGLDALRPRVLGAARQRLAGALGLGAVLAAAGFGVWLLVHAPGLLGTVFALYFAYAGLAFGCLLREGAAAARAIESGSLDEARRAVGLLVSRDVSALERPALYKTLAESLSENFNDAFVAPFFWLCLGGPVLLWFYKAASTADSMWGYRHEPWTRAGWAAARLDDVLAFVPARLSMLFLWLGAADKALWPGLALVVRDARRMESPNAGWSMSAAAWLHGAGMGGSAVYAGAVKDKPLLGPAGTSWDYEKIGALLTHLRRSGLVCALALWAFSLIIHLLCR